MRKAVFWAIFALCLASCATTRHIGTDTAQRDSISVQVIERTEYVHDTIRIETPAEVVERITPDTISTIRTKTAISEARIQVGQLYHRLEILPQIALKPITKPIIHRDSVRVVVREVAKVERIAVPRPLTWWQKIRLRGFWILLGVLIWRHRLAVGKILRTFVTCFRSLI